MSKKAAQVSTVCACIEHCFAFTMWCDDFARYVDPEDMWNGQERAYDVISDATRLHSFLAIRKLDEFLSEKKARGDDLIANDMGIDISEILGDVGEKLLSQEERENINKGVTHLTERLTLDPDSEVDLHNILARSIPVLIRLVAKLRNINECDDVVSILDRTESLIVGKEAVDVRRTYPHWRRP